MQGGNGMHTATLHQQLPTLTPYMPPPPTDQGQSHLSGFTDEWSKISTDSTCSTDINALNIPNLWPAVPPPLPPQFGAPSSNSPPLKGDGRTASPPQQPSPPPPPHHGFSTAQPPQQLLRHDVRGAMDPRQMQMANNGQQHFVSQPDGANLPPSSTLPNAPSSGGNTAGVDAKYICRHFVKGRCTWGAECRFVHPSTHKQHNGNDSSHQQQPQPPQQPQQQQQPSQQIRIQHQPPPPQQQIPMPQLLQQGMAGGRNMQMYQSQQPMQSLTVDFSELSVNDRGEAMRLQMMQQPGQQILPGHVAYPQPHVMHGANKGGHAGGKFEGYTLHHSAPPHMRPVLPANHTGITISQPAPPEGDAQGILKYSPAPVGVSSDDHIANKQNQIQTERAAIVAAALKKSYTINIGDSGYEITLQQRHPTQFFIERLLEGQDVGAELTKLEENSRLYRTGMLYLVGDEVMFWSAVKCWHANHTVYNHQWDLRFQRAERGDIDCMFNSTKKCLVAGCRFTHSR